MNLELLWIFKILGVGILEIKSETLYTKILKMNSKFLETLGTEILKIESKTLWIFGNFGYKNFKKGIRNFVNFWKLWVRKL